MAGRPRRRAYNNPRCRDSKGRYISLRAPEYPLDPRRTRPNPDFDYSPGLRSNRLRALALVQQALNEALEYPAENYLVVSALEQVEAELIASVNRSE